MAIFNPAELDFGNEKFSMLIYGAPGVGKSTLAGSAPKPILIDLDKGIRRVKAEHRPVTSRVSTYEEMLEDLQSEAMRNFETVILDTGGAFVSLLQDYVMRKDPANRTKGGTISQKGFGAVKSEFVRLTNWLKTSLDKNIVYVFHAVEEKNKEGNPIQRLMCEGSAKNIVWQPCDFGCYLYKNGDKTIAAFSPTDEYFAKGCYGINGLFELPFGEGIKNDFLTKLFERANKTLAEEGEYYKEEKRKYEKVIEEGKAIIEGIKSPDDAAKVGEEMASMNHVLTSREELRQVFKDKVKSLGFVWDAKKRAYTLPAEQKSDGADKESTDTKEVAQNAENKGGKAKGGK